MNGPLALRSVLFCGRFSLWTINTNGTPSDIVRLITGRSAHDLREEFPHLKKLPALLARSFLL